MGMVEDKLAELGVALPSPSTPAANYVPYVIAGDLLFVSGQVCLGPDRTLAPQHTGKLGAEVSFEAGYEAAKICAVNVLAQAKAALGGDLDRIRRCVRLGGFINADPVYPDVPKVMNGASDLMVAVLGDRGRHARTTIGVAVLPSNAAVEVDAVFEIA